jgi:hypothetical protein
MTSMKELMTLGKTSACRKTADRGKDPCQAFAFADSPSLFSMSIKRKQKLD